MSETTMEGRKHVKQDGVARKSRVTTQGGSLMDWPIVAFVTPRLTVRDARPSDEGVFLRLFSDAEVRAYLGGPVADAELSKRVAATPGPGVFTVEHTATGNLVGLIHIGPHRTGDVELSYEFVPEVWGQGMAREACAPVLLWAQRDVAHGAPVIAVTQVANARSVRLLRSLGMVEREHFREFGAEQVLMTTAG